MGFFSRKKEKRSITGEEEGSWLWNFIGQGARSKAGQDVNVDTAMKVTAVYACVRVISEAIASTPFLLYKRTKDPETKKDIKERDTKHPLADLIKISPNKEMTAYEMKEFMGSCLSLWGNFYAFKVQNGLGRIMGLWPLLPGYMKVERKDGEIVYTYSPAGLNKPLSFTQKEIWHIKGLSKDGIAGMSPIALMREAIGLAMSAEEYGAKFFENDARPTVAITTPAKLSDDQVENLKKGWAESYAGSKNAANTAVLQGNMDLKIIGMPNQDAQFLQTREFQVADIARAFNIPGVMIGLTDKTSTFASAEQFFLSFAVHTMIPWFSRIENSANFHLLNELDRKKYFTEFLMANLTRGDIKSRFEAYNIAIQSRIMNPNEARALENMNPYEGGDEFANPNITPGPPDDEAEPDDEPEDEEIEDEE